MPYRTELRRPDLKGTFRCSLCSKIFCHSSSLSRHRMQAHFKSYTCTLCNKEITSNETLRAHMYKKHQISRMFMCRCCNWAFPDKTSLHIHMQAMATGNPGNVSIIAKSSASPPPGQGTAAAVNVNGSPVVSGIFPAMPTIPSIPQSREELFNRLREKSMFASLFPGFPKFNPSAVSDNLGDGNNNRMNGVSPGLLDASMQNVEEINCEDPDDGMAEVEYGESFEGSDNGSRLSPEEAVSPSRRFSTESLKKDESASDTPPSMVRVKNDLPQLQMPILRSAISASPLNSLMYHKKLSNALRNKRNDNHSSNNFLNPNFSFSPIPRQPEIVSSPNQHHNHHTVVNRAPANSSPIPPPTVVKEERQTPPRPTINVRDTMMDGPPSTDSHISPTDSASSNSSAHSAHCCASTTPPVDVKPGQCFQCQIVKGKLAQSENRCRFLESRTTSQESKISRLENRVTTLESNNRRYETETVSLRDHCDNLERKILECQEKVLKHLSSNNFNQETKQILHEVMETFRVYKS